MKERHHMTEPARHIRLLLTLVGLLAFSLWLPIALITYAPGWHAESCQWHPRCAQYDEGRAAGNDAQQRISELRYFMLHRSELSALHWTDKERTHLREVRTLLDHALVIAFLGALIFMHASARDRARVARWAMLMAATCVIVLPFFDTFWKDMLHPLLFSNKLWLNKPADTSWWIMPRIYFNYTTALVIGSAVLICAAVRYQALRQIRLEK